MSEKPGIEMLRVAADLVAEIVCSACRENEWTHHITKEINGEKMERTFCPKSCFGECMFKYDATLKMADRILVEKGEKT